MGDHLARIRAHRLLRVKILNLSRIMVHTQHFETCLHYIVWGVFLTVVNYALTHDLICIKDCCLRCTLDLLHFVIKMTYVLHKKNLRRENTICIPERAVTNSLRHYRSSTLNININVLVSCIEFGSLNLICNCALTKGVPHLSSFKLLLTK